MSGLYVPTGPGTGVVEKARKEGACREEMKERSTKVRRKPESPHIAGTPPLHQKRADRRAGRSLEDKRRVGRLSCTDRCLSAWAEQWAGSKAGVWVALSVLERVCCSAVVMVAPWAVETGRSMAAQSVARRAFPTAACWELWSAASRADRWVHWKWGGRWACRRADATEFSSAA